ncbi:MAG TPA: 4Fe-4S binding protein [Candidatus Ozemobacteraceae bacterium]
MKRKIIRIDESKCNGCGLCIPGCHEGALQIVDGKARLVADVYCDGLGACLGECPQGALTIEEREAVAFDQKVVDQRLTALKAQKADGCPSQAHGHAHRGGCPGSTMRQMNRPAPTAPSVLLSGSDLSQLGHWPVQLMLVPPTAPFLREADILLCADCVPFALPDFHSRYLAGRPVLVGCPKLDNSDHYLEKLTEMFKVSRPKRVTVLRMEVPCCGGLAWLAEEARQASGLDFPLEIHTIGIQGGVINRKDA